MVGNTCLYLHSSRNEGVTRKIITSKRTIRLLQRFLDLFFLCFKSKEFELGIVTVITVINCICQSSGPQHACVFLHERVLENL